jgi:hypothetical protein
LSQAIKYIQVKRAAEPQFDVVVFARRKKIPCLENEKFCPVNHLSEPVKSFKSEQSLSRRISKRVTISRME